MKTLKNKKTRKFSILNFQFSILILLSAFCFLPFSIFAQGGTAGPLTWNLDNGVLTISGTGDMPNYEFREILYCHDCPAEITSTSPWGLLHNLITTVIIENGVTSVGDFAFFFCEKLNSVNLPNTLTRIGENAFTSCSILKDIVLPNSLEIIDVVAFGDTKIEFFTIPRSVISIGQGGTPYPNLISIHVDIENNHYASEDGVLFNKNKTSLICYPTRKPGREYIIPNSVKNIERAAFLDCLRLISITIPNGVIDIGESAFDYCISLTSIIIPNSVKNIRSEAFCQCLSLTSITIPNSVENIGNFAFSSCRSLTSITNLNPIPLAINPKVFNNIDLDACRLEVPYGSVQAYKDAPVWKEFNVLPLSVEGYDSKTSSGEQLTIYPNPNTGACNIVIPEEFLYESFLTLSIYDASGILVQQIEILNETEDLNIKLDQKAKGIYMAVLSNGKRSYRGKIVFK